MTTILSDDFTTLANWSGGSLVAGRTGNGMQIAGSGNSTYAIPSGPLRKPGGTVSFSWRTTNIAVSRPSLSVVTGGTDQLTLTSAADGSISVRLGGAGSGTIGTSAPGLIAANTWYTIELAYHIANTGGIARVKVDGTQVINLTSTDTQVVAGADIDQYTLRGPGTGQSSIYDDFLGTDVDPALSAIAKVWNGTTFDTCPVKVWTGSAFADAIAVKTWNGSAFL